MAHTTKHNPMDDILRARLQIAEGKRLKLSLIRHAMYAFDAINRGLTRQPFFALRESEALLIKLDGLTGEAFIRALLSQNGGTTITAHGLEHVPQTGPVIIAATHPIGTFDYIAHAGALLGRRPDLKVVANREAERFLGADSIVAVDINKHHQATSARATQTGMRAHLADGGALLIFGSGRVPDLKDGRLREPEWRSGATRVSKACDVPVVPASADMRNSRHYYRTRRLARIISGGNEDFAARIASLRYVSELLAKLGGAHDVYYGPANPPGTSPAALKAQAEALVPGVYAPE